MGPKVEAACRFVMATGKTAGIGALSDLSRIIAGEAGTQVDMKTTAPEYDERPLATGARP
jgi:carbamate kinase